MFHLFRPRLKVRFSPLSLLVSSIRHPTFYRDQKKYMKRKRSGEGKGREKGKQRGRKKIRNGQCHTPPPPPRPRKKNLAFVRWQIKILYILVCNLGKIYLFGKNSFLSKTKG